MKPSKFDELTKALATSTSRRQALRRIGGILGGTALAGLFPGLASASTSACAHFCNAVFGADTPAADQCISDAAHHKGLCYTCGPASSGGTKPICCPENGSGQCTSYSSATCCTSGLTCLNGQCVTSCVANGGQCTSGQDCCSGRCDSSSGTCVSCIPNGDSLCLADSDCCSGLCETYYGICGCGIAGSDCLRNEDCCSNTCTISGFCG